MFVLLTVVAKRDGIKRVGGRGTEMFWPLLMARKGGKVVCKDHNAVSITKIPKLFYHSTNFCQTFYISYAFGGRFFSYGNCVSRPLNAQSIGLNSKQAGYFVQDAC